jgi:hypothetical protein
MCEGFDLEMKMKAVVSPSLALILSLGLSSLSLETHFLCSQ